MTILEAKNLHKSYGNKFNKQEVLKGLDFSFEKGNSSALWDHPDREKRPF